MPENYYVYELCASFQQQAKLPPDFKPYLNRHGLLNLRGEQLAALLPKLLAVVRRGDLHNAYLTPFYDDRNRHRLVDTWHNYYYDHGCGAAVQDREQAAAFFARLDQYTLNRPVRRRSDQEAPARPPLIFADNGQMAGAMENYIRTGSFAGDCAQPPMPSPERPGVDPELLFWIENTLGRPPQGPADLAELRGLNMQFYIPGCYPKYPDWLAPEPGNWQLLGEMPNLQSLFLPELRLADYSFLSCCRGLRQLGLSRTDLADSFLLEDLAQLTMLELPGAELGDFSFLARFKQLEILDLSRTDFRDCRLLTKLPELRLVYLPAERQLLHAEELAPLPMQVKTYPKRFRGAEIAPFELIEPNAALITETIDIAPPYKALHIDADYNSAEGAEITVKYLQKLLSKVAGGRLEMVVASLSPWGEEEFMELDMAEGWAAIGWEDEDNDCWYSIYNPAEAGNQEDAPPEIGGQSPVPKMHAIEDLQLAADCLAWFIKYGQLYPGAYWAKYYK